MKTVIIALVSLVVASSALAVVTINQTPDPVKMVLENMVDNAADHVGQKAIWDKEIQKDNIRREGFKYVGPDVGSPTSLTNIA